MPLQAVFACIATCLSILSSRVEEPKETKLKPTAILSGTHSQIKKERFVLVTSADAWETLWEEHRGKNGSRFTESIQEFDINFETQYVIAIFVHGANPPTITPRIRADAIVIGFRENYFQTEGRPQVLRPEEQAREDAISPYAFVILPRPVQSVIVEQDVQATLGQPPVWKERSRLSAPKGKK